MISIVRLRAAIGVVLVTLVAACGGAAQTATPAGTPAAGTPAGGTATEAASASPSLASATPAPSGEATVDGPAEVEAGSEFTVSWTGPNAQDDFITIVKAGTEAWTNEDYFYTRFGNEGSLVAPLEAGDYELWYVAAADNSTQARSPITVTGFTGSLEAPEDVEAGSEFEVDWTGPNGPGDYVAIVAAGTERWTDESYFYTASGSPGTLVAPTSPGAHEVWYVTGLADTPSARRPITVIAATVTLEAPATVEAGEAFEVRWTGPNGPSDYITIVPVGSAEGTYGDYAYTSTGNPVTLTAPDMPGNYEIWYASDRVEGTFGRRPIVVE